MNCLTLFNDCNQRILTILYILYPYFLQGCGFQSSFSSGDFVDVQQGRPTTSTTMQDEGRDSEEEPSNEWASDDLSGGLFSCPNEGCVKVYQRYSSLEKHLSFGKCKLVPERDTLLDKAKKLYHQKLLEGTTSQGTIEGDIISQDCARSPPEGAALKSTKKATRFNDAQKRYLDEKFNLGQETGHKLDPAIVARDMRYARNKDGTRQFTSGEFLSAQQIQSFFSRKSSRLHHTHPEGDLESQTDDLAAGEEQQAYDNTRGLVLREVHLPHPIVFDTYNLCNMHKNGKLNKLSVAMLRAACEHFDLNVEGITARLKAPYISLLQSLVLSCDCCPPASQ